jgi:hypothetical protein
MRDGKTYSGTGVGAADLLVGAGTEDVLENTADGEETGLRLAAVVGAVGALDVAVVGVVATVSTVSWGGSRDAGSGHNGGDDLGDLHICGWLFEAERLERS